MHSRDKNKYYLGENTFCVPDFLKILQENFKHSIYVSQKYFHYLLNVSSNNITNIYVHITSSSLSPVETLLNLHWQKKPLIRITHHSPLKTHNL